MRTKAHPKPLRSVAVRRGKPKTLLPGWQILQMKDTTYPDLLLDGSLDFQAGEGENAEDKFFLKANTGKPVTLGNFPHPVIVDMAGAKFDKKTTPVIADHDTSLRIGHSTEQLILKSGESKSFAGRNLVGPLIVASGVRSSDSDISKQFKAEAKKGFPFQVSIGARIRKGYLLEEGDTARVNGRDWEGPLIVAKESTIRELTITVLGADNDTSAILAKESDMKFQEWLASLKLSLDGMEEDQKEVLMAEYKKLYPSKKGKTKKVEASEPEEDEDEEEEEGTKGRRKAKKALVTAGAADDDADIRAAERAERIQALDDLTAEFADSVKEVTLDDDTKIPFKKFKAHAIRSKMSAETYELHLRRSELPNLKGGGVAIHTVNRDMNAKALEVSILRFYGHKEQTENKITGAEYGLKAMGYSDKELELADKSQHRFSGSISEILAHQIAAAGRHPTAYFNDPSALMGEAVRAWGDIKAFSGASGLLITNVLENVMHKETLASFEAQETTWRAITGVRSLSDFRPHNSYRLDMNGHFRKVPTDGELKHIGLTDTKYTLQADTYGAMIAVDRKTRIDDDLGVVMTKARGIGMLGALRVEEAVYVLLLSNPGSFFAAGNGNLITGGGTVLSIAAFTTAQQKFRDQVVNGKPIAIAPSILLAGTNNAVLAGRLYNEARIGGLATTGDAFDNNPFAGLYRPVISGYLNNTNITDQDGNTLSGQSTTHWYLFPNPNAPQGSALVIGFLNGRQTPFIDEAETQFNVPGGIQMRAYFDFGVAMHVTQLALRSAGA
jgi:hypothetical protein